MIRMNEGLVRIEQRWPIRLHWQRRARLAYPLFGRWWVEAGGARDVRIDRTIYRVWRICLICGHDRVEITEQGVQPITAEQYAARLAERRREAA